MQTCLPAPPTRGFLCSQTFQKLIFISGLVFGDQKSAFLLPWKRVFNMTDSQVSVAKRDSAKALFKTFLDARGGHLQARLPPPQHTFVTIVRHLASYQAAESGGCCPRKALPWMAQSLVQTC